MVRINRLYKLVLRSSLPRQSRKEVRGEEEEERERKEGREGKKGIYKSPVGNTRSVRP